MIMSTDRPCREASAAPSKFVAEPPRLTECLPLSAWLCAIHVRVYSFVLLSVPEIHSSCCWDIKQPRKSIKQADKQTNGKQSKTNRQADKQINRQTSNWHRRVKRCWCVRAGVSQKYSHVYFDNCCRSQPGWATAGS